MNVDDMVSARNQLCDIGFVVLVQNLDGGDDSSIVICFDPSRFSDQNNAKKSSDFQKLNVNILDKAGNDCRSTG